MPIIPPVTVKHVEKALAEIDRHGVPPRRGATGFALRAKGRMYPPKYVLGLAVKHATGKELPASSFDGGEPTNAILRKLGFKVKTLDSRALKGDRAPRPRQGPGKQTKASSLPRSTAYATPGVPTIARLVLKGRPSNDPTVQRDILLEFIRHWPHKVHAKFLITPGGFLRLPFPSDWPGETGWDSTPADLGLLIRHAAQAIDKLIMSKLIQAAAGKVDVVTLGVDMMHWDKKPLVAFSHVELVAVIDVQMGKIIAWTGKSYPVATQERKLVHVTNLASHLVKIAGERVLVLGCHDLNMFSPRAWANQSDNSRRRQRCKEMVSLTKRFRPTVVLQHPHQTDSPRIWALGWSGVLGNAKTPRMGNMSCIKAYASGIAYFSPNGTCRAPMDNVLSKTQHGAVFNYAVPAR